MDWRYLFSRDWGQQCDIESQRQEIDRLKQEVFKPRFGSTTDSELERLRNENGKLMLYIAVLFRILESKRIVNRDEIIELMERIDQEDGTYDNAYTGDIPT